MDAQMAQERRHPLQRFVIMRVYLRATPACVALPQLLSLGHGSPIRVLADFLSSKQK